MEKFVLCGYFTKKSQFIDEFVRNPMINDLGKAYIWVAASEDVKSLGHLSLSLSFEKEN